MELISSFTLANISYWKSLSDSSAIVRIKSTSHNLLLIVILRTTAILELLKNLMIAEVFLLFTHCLLFCCKTGEDEDTKKAKQKLALEGQTMSEANAELNDSNAIGQSCPHIIYIITVTNGCNRMKEYFKNYNYIRNHPVNQYFCCYFDMKSTDLFVIVVIRTKSNCFNSADFFVETCYYPFDFWIISDHEPEPSAVEKWMESVAMATSLSQLYVLLSLLEMSVAWSKSALHARCRICRRKNDGEHMLLCDGCDRGHHMYCLKPPITVSENSSFICVLLFKAFWSVSYLDQLVVVWPEFWFLANSYQIDIFILCQEEWVDQTAYLIWRKATNFLNGEWSFHKLNESFSSTITSANRENHAIYSYHCNLLYLNNILQISETNICINYRNLILTID